MKHSSTNKIIFNILMTIEKDFDVFNIHPCVCIFQLRSACQLADAYKEMHAK